MSVADYTSHIKSKTEGMEAVPTANLDPPKARGFKAVPKTHKESPRWNVGIASRKATEKANAGNQTNPDPAKPNKEIGNRRITPRAPKEPEMDRARPLL